MNWRAKLLDLSFTVGKTLLLLFAIFCIYGGLDNLLNPDEPGGDFGRIADIFLGVLIWLVTCQLHLPLRMDRR